MCLIKKNTKFSYIIWAILPRNLTSELDVYEWSVSRSGCFISLHKTFRNHWEVGGWDSEVLWTYEEQKNVLHILEIELILPYRPGCSLVIIMIELHWHKI